MATLRPALALSILMLGCAADQGEEAAALLQQALSATQASLAMAGGAPAPRGPAAGAAPPAAALPARIATPPAVAPGPRQRGAAPPGSAAALLGTNAEQMRRMLGDPALRRAEGEAEIWLYEAAPCRLDVILYPQGTALVVAHATARAHGSAQGVTEAACLSAIAGAPATQPWGDPGRRA